ncbi:hypothetical protein OC834_005622 [Tilletia horrida]|uniref:Uncharacterized protein n=1 Tax=Tilletia horrida TaxID=155126 RepID=A0AAN6G5N5_9BASI|nr:hypothetical protein OC842_007723 [Tilletia horrida]KAK0524208.1 hypothetical protein OC834_005622 [Tilletia horrida]KAK0557652.1 hypothetical protein OC844_005521 [Tilletia horrida]
MAAASRPPASGRSNKWPTNLSICADLILGMSQSEDSVHEVDASFGSSDGSEHNGKLNIWSRDPVGQGLYLAVNVAIATHPLRLSVSDAYNLRFVPEAIDGTDPDMPCLPPGPTCAKGTAIVISVSEDRKSCVVMGFTYLNKTHQWQKFKIRLVFEATIRWEPWTCSPVGTLVDFEALITSMDDEHTFEAVIRRLSSIEANTKSLQQALQMSSPAVNRAALVRQARAAGAAARGLRQPSPSPSPSTASGTSGAASALVDDTVQTGDAGPSTPPARKHRRLNASS